MTWIHVGRGLALAGLLATLGNSSPAQCTGNGIQSQPYGASCPPNSRSPWLLAQFSLPQCAVELLLIMPGNQVLGGWLAFSLSPQQSPQQGLGVCPLMTSPLAIYPVDATGRLTLVVPRGLPPLTFYVNGIAHYWQPVFHFDWVEPALFGLQIALQ